MPQFVLTGANGFIGTNLVSRILSIPPDDFGFQKAAIPHFSDFEDLSNKDRYIKVLATDIPSSLTRTTAHRFASSARYQYVDYESLITQLESQSAPPDLIVHNGACSSTTEQNPAIFAKLNLAYTQSLWEYCTKYQVPFIYASSAATYGNGLLGFSDKKEDCERYTALNLYGKSKLDFDIWALKQKKTPSTWFGLRYFNVYGSHEAHKGSQASMIYHGYHQAIQARKIRLFQTNTDQYKDGEQLRDFIFIDDIIEIIVKLMQLSLNRKYEKSSLILPENGLFLNVGCGITQSWNSLAKNVFEALSMPINIEYIPMPDNVKNQYQNYTCADLNTLTSIGIEHEFHSLKEGITRYIQRHLMRGQ